MKLQIVLTEDELEKLNAEFGWFLPERVKMFEEMLTQAYDLGYARGKDDRA